MSCNKVIQEEIRKEYDYINCPFCYKQISSRKKMKTVLACCDKQEIIDVDGTMVCKSCGVIQYIKYHKEYIDFNENKYKMRKKSVYIRKYHLNNSLNDICKENNIQLLKSDQLKIFEIFDRINKVLPELNQNRKRVISIKYMIKKIFDMLKIEYKYIQITKSVNTLKYYENYWSKLRRLINL